MMSKFYTKFRHIYISMREIHIYCKNFIAIEKNKDGKVLVIIVV